MIDDAALVEEALSGGAERFAPIVDRYRDAVFGIALARTGSFHDAEDVAQDVFVEAFQQLGGLKNPARLGAWLRSITIHRCIDSLRRSYRNKALPNVVQDLEAGSIPSDEAARQELREQIMAAVSRLSNKQRETTMLFYIDGYSLEEVARMQEVPVGTAKRRLHDARKKLQEELVNMTEDVLKANALKGEFTVRVMDILTRFSGLQTAGQKMSWRELYAAFRSIGTRGVEGISKALQSPHAPTRIIAAHMMIYLYKVQSNEVAGCDDEVRETIVSLLKNALNDRNKKVRKFAIALLYLDVDDERKRREFVPLLAPLLLDQSKRVRRCAAWDLRSWASEVPLNIVAQALVDERDPYTRASIEQLMRIIVNPLQVPTPYGSHW